MGREAMSTIRSTFLINSEGVLIRFWDSVNVKGHAKEVLEAIRSLK